MSSLMSSPGLERLSDDEYREITRRLASMDANPSAMRPWSEVEARILRSLGLPPFSEDLARH